MRLRWYNKALQSFLRGQIDWLNDDIKAILTYNSYQPSGGDVEMNSLYSDIPDGAILAISSGLTGKTVQDGGVCDADDPIISGVGSGYGIYSVILWDATLDRLLVVWDTGTVPNPPPFMISDGSDIKLVWSNSQYEKILRLNGSLTGGNSLYYKAADSFAKKEISWDTDTIKAVLVKSGYTPDLDTHQYLSSIAGANRVATSGALTGKATTAGYAQAANVTYTSVTGDAVYYVVLFKDTGNEATSPLIAVFNTMTGLPLTPDGSNITIQWANTAPYIFRI